MRSALPLTLVLCATLLGCPDTTRIGGSSDSGDDGGGDSGVDVDAGRDGGLDAGCQSSGECPGAQGCFSGICCDVPERICNGACCPGASLCLFNRCVSPGADCRATRDCAAGEYCEPWFAGDAGAVDAGAQCAAASSPVGRCVAMPPLCPADGGSTPGCTARCEVRPAGGALDAVVKWEWAPRTFTTSMDVWSTPAVGRLVDANCDGRIDELDSPDVVFVSGDAKGVCCGCLPPDAGPSTCHTGVLRVVDGRTGFEVWSLDKAEPSSVGFMGSSVAIGDLDDDGRLEIAAMTGEGYVVVLDNAGRVMARSPIPVPGSSADGVGWGGGLSLADLDQDGDPEVIFGATVFTFADAGLALRFGGPGFTAGRKGVGGGLAEALSTAAELDGNPDSGLELLAGRTLYAADGAVLWNRLTGRWPDGGVQADGGLLAIADGHSAVGDLDGDGRPEVILVETGRVWVLDGATGATRAGPLELSGTGTGGPPTVADFDGDGHPEIGIAQREFYFVLEPVLAGARLEVLWATSNHDLSSSVTGSTVFDFEGDGAAEVIYGDECYLWVFDGKTGKVRFAVPHTSFTATESSIVADLDGDGRAEMLMVSNGASPTRWKCNVAPWTTDDVDAGRPAWTPPSDGGVAYRGLTVFRDRANAWVGTRALWNQHTYHVTNVCDDTDTACGPSSRYGAIPQHERSNWRVPWLNSFRQNVQEKGLFNAPDAVVSVVSECTEVGDLDATVGVRNIGQAPLPPGVPVALSRRDASADVELWRGATTRWIYPGQTEAQFVRVPAALADARSTLVAKVLSQAPASSRECRVDNNESAPTRPLCLE